MSYSPEQQIIIVETLQVMLEALEGQNEFEPYRPFYTNAKAALEQLHQAINVEVSNIDGAGAAYKIIQISQTIQDLETAKLLLEELRKRGINV